MTAWLALDQGTTASKAAVFDHRGRVLGMGRAEVRSHHGPGGAVWQDPLRLESGMRRAIALAMAAAGEPRLEAAGICSQRSTFVLWERRTGRPVGHAPTWQSTEAAAVCEGLAGHARRVRRLTGLPLSPHYSASKLALRLRRDPDLRRRARRGDVLFGPVATWLLWRLSGGALHAADPTLAARTLLFDIDRLDWSAALLDLFGVPAAMLPLVRPSLGPFGAVRVGRREVPVRALLGDQQAALAGTVGLRAPARGAPLLVNLGTGGFVLHPTGPRLERRDGLLSSLAWTEGGRRCHLLEGTINGAGAALDWLRAMAGTPRDRAALDRLCGRARATVHVVPAFWGMGSAFSPGREPVPSVIASAAGAPWSRADLAAGTVASVAHATAHCVRLATRGRSAGEVVVSGPLARLRPLMRTLSAILGRSVAAARQGEATLAGAALAASGGSLPIGTREARMFEAGARERAGARAAHETWLALIARLRGWPGGSA